MIRAAAYRIEGHFGELLQGRLGTDGPLALVSLPCTVLSVSARQTKGRQFLLHPTARALVSPYRARQFLNDLGLHTPGPVNLWTNMPVGGGAGSSTATLVALAQAAGWRGDPMALAAACLRSEGASDPLMFHRPERLLWASRIGVVLDRLPALPLFEVVGGFYGAGRRTDPQDLRFPDISDLVADWERAARSRSLVRLAELASVSADRTLAMRHSDPDPIALLARETGALGHVIGHTGSARGLIFPRHEVPIDAADKLHRAGLRAVVRFVAGGEDRP